MRLSDYKTGMILKEVNGYTLVLCILDSVVEEAKQEIARYDANEIGMAINGVLYNISTNLLKLEDEKVDFTKEINSSLIFTVHLGYLQDAKVVKTVKPPENWVLKNQMLYPELRGLMTFEDGLKELQSLLFAMENKLYGVQ